MQNQAGNIWIFLLHTYSGRFPVGVILMSPSLLHSSLLSSQKQAMLWTETSLYKHCSGYCYFPNPRTKPVWINSLLQQCGSRSTGGSAGCLGAEGENEQEDLGVLGQKPSANGRGRTDGFLPLPQPQSTSGPGLRHTRAGMLDCGWAHHWRRSGLTQDSWSQGWGRALKAHRWPLSKQ